jgi:hypothetical protein
MLILLFVKLLVFTCMSKCQVSSWNIQKMEEGNRKNTIKNTKQQEQNEKEQLKLIDINWNNLTGNFQYFDRLMNLIFSLSTKIERPISP